MHLSSFTYLTADLNGQIVAVDAVTLAGPSPRPPAPHPPPPPTPLALPRQLVHPLFSSPVTPINTSLNTCHDVACGDGMLQHACPSSQMTLN